jgi:two-component system sensor histidine kinase BaeS
MKLRLRFALTAVAVMLPVVFALFWFNADAQHRAAEQVLTAFVVARMPAQRALCEASPATWGGPLAPFGVGPPREPPPRDPSGRGPPHGPRSGPEPPPGPPPPYLDLDHRPRARPAEAFGYAADLRSQNPASPPISARLAAAIEGHDSAVAPFAWQSSEVVVLLRMPWTEGPCAFVLARGSTDSRWGSILPETEVWLLPMLAVLAAVLLAVGPVVRRIQKLTEAVQRSASRAYSSPVAMDGGDEIADLARAFDAAGREIRAQLQENEQREQALRHFLGNTTHDVMIPLTVLQGHLATLREHAAAGRPLDVSVVISAMDEAHYMASLVHNLAVTARLEAADVELQRTEIDLNGVLQRVIGRHRLIARELGVELESAVPEGATLVSADVTLIEQAVSNVTYNAIRYNRAGGHVAVILEPTAQDRFCISVIDDGPGIPDAELSRLSERGARGAEARTRAPEGQGLGLHIAYRAAALHGFRLTLQRSEYGGLEVKLEGDLAPRRAD